MMLEESGGYLERTLEMAALESELASCSAAVEEVVAATTEAFSRLKECLSSGKTPVTWTRPGEEASFVASVALKHVRERCASIVDAPREFGSAARTFSLTFQRVDEAIRQGRCEKSVLLQRREKPETNQALAEALEGKG